MLFRTSVFVVAGLWIHQSAATAAPPVEGDAALLTTLRDVQATNISSFATGRLSASVVDRVTHYGADVTVTWTDGHVRWEGVSHERTRDVGNDGKVTERLLTQSIRMVETPTELLCYWPDIRLAQIIHGKRAGYHKEMELRPARAWFGMEVFVTWEKLFNPERAAKTVAKFVVRAEDNHRVAVDLHCDNGDVLHIVASMDHGGNVVEYESFPKKGAKGMKRSGTFDWQKQHESGIWILKRYRCKRFAPDSEVLDMDYDLEVTSFDPLPAIPAAQFSFDSLKVAPGTKVEDIGATHRVYRIGDKPMGIEQDDLDRLIELFRSAGFSALQR
jgi:hypothetical protein